MVTILIGVTIGLLGFIGVLLVHLQRENNNRFFELATEVLNDVRVDLMGAIEEHRHATEADLFFTLRENTEQIERNKQTAIDHAKGELVFINDKLKRDRASTAEEYKRLDTHFRKSQEDDPARHLMSCAYALVAKNRTPRDELDSALIHAVIAHRKTGDDIVSPKSKTLEKLPKKEDLN